MLAQADAYKSHGFTSQADVGRNLIGPEGANAVELYRKVLTAQPGNQQAKRGLHEIAGFYQGFARKNCNAQRWGACMTDAQGGLKAEPHNAQLKQLERQAEGGASDSAPTH